MQTLTRPWCEQLNGYRSRAFWFTGLARAGYFHGYDDRALLPWLCGVGEEICLNRFGRGNHP